MSSYNILYIEDEERLGKVTQEVLESSGYIVTWLKEGGNALAVFNSGSYDICIIDIMLPGLDGYSVVEKIRERDNNTPIIFLSARSLTQDVVKGFRAGGNDYMRKPFSIEELIVRIEALLSRNKQVEVKLPEGTIAIGNYIFDRISMTLSLGEEMIKLTHMESELLYRLVSRKNEVLSRKQTLIELWEDDSFFNARSMDVFITRLRKYLRKDERISIVNIRGKGFKLIFLD